jgi:eukaryotic-like serine/threonine-protein kinase
MIQHPTSVGKYELEQFLGGGMSHVYRAKDRVLGRRVALKLLTEEGTSDAETKARFLLEARMASNINHENIISVYDFGEDRGRPFIVMEFLEGESLRGAIRNRHLGDFQSRMSIALQVARALDHIHARKIIHRDVKPENIHVDAGGRVKLVDFGIAKAEGVQLTRAGFTLGTPHYMAPEQVLGKPLTPQVDIYAFGILLFELLTGAKPLGGGTVERIFHEILHAPLNLEPLNTANVPVAACALIERCTAKDPAERPQTFAPLCEEIERLARQAHSECVVRVKRERQPKSVPQPRPQSAAPKAAERLPAFLEKRTANALCALNKLPPALRTQGGLMFLAGSTVVALLLALYSILVLAHLL